jgi:hypothetical protein
MKELRKGSYGSLKAQTVGGSRSVNGANRLASKIPRNGGVDPLDTSGYGRHSQEMTTTESEFTNMVITGLRPWVVLPRRGPLYCNMERVASKTSMGIENKM